MNMPKPVGKHNYESDNDRLNIIQLNVDKDRDGMLT